MWIIYGLECTAPGCEDSGVVRYVGQTQQDVTQRLRGHLAHRTNRVGRKYAWVHEHGARNIRAVILEAGLDSQALADERETHWIQKLNTFALDSDLGLNLTRGGSRPPGGDDEIRLAESENPTMRAKKLNWEIVTDIRAQYATTDRPVQDIADDFSVVLGTAYAIIANRNWVDESYTYVKRPRKNWNTPDSGPHPNCKHTLEEAKAIRSDWARGVPPRFSETEVWNFFPFCDGNWTKPTLLRRRILRAHDRRTARATQSLAPRERSVYSEGCSGNPSKVHRSRTINQSACGGLPSESRRY